MYIKIWTPGTDKELDQLFDSLRNEQFNDRSHILYKNYSSDSFEECPVISISFDNDEPVVASSILHRECWPKGAYRIVNRLWKVKKHRLFNIDKNDGMDVFCMTVAEQTKYAEKYLNAELVFMSRQYGRWQSFAKDLIKKKVNIDFKYDDYKYLTCNNYNDSTCWQKILFKGNNQLLQYWPKKL